MTDRRNFGNNFYFYFFCLSFVFLFRVSSCDEIECASIFVEFYQGMNKKKKCSVIGLFDVFILTYVEIANWAEEAFQTIDFHFNLWSNTK